MAFNDDFSFDFDDDCYVQRNLTKSQLIKFILQDIKENLKNQLQDY